MKIYARCYIAPIQMKSKWFSKFKVFSLVLLSLVAVYYIFFRAPSEAQMVAKFHQHRAEFEQIRLMLGQDKNVQTIGPNWITPKYGYQHELPLNIFESRIELYRSRLKKLGFERVDSYKGQVDMPEFGGGFGSDTWGVGYIWSAKPLKPLVKSAYSERPQRDQWIFSRLEGNWYLYRRR